MTERAFAISNPPHINLRLPREVEAHAAGKQLLETLSAHQSLLWADSDFRVPTMPVSARLTESIRDALRARALVRGLQTAERALTDEARGMDIADAKSGTSRGNRVSRLLIISSDGAQRFYRQVEAIIRHHPERLFVLRLETDERGLGEPLFGTGTVARAVLLTTKEAVSAALVALAEDLFAESQPPETVPQRSTPEGSTRESLTPDSPGAEAPSPRSPWTKNPWPQSPRK